VLFNLPSLISSDNEDLNPDANTPQSKNGLILIQIDGLGQAEFNKALKNGEMPFLASLLDREHYRVYPLYSGLPSSTPAVQGELFYGTKTAVPAFAYCDQLNGHLHKMYEPSSAAAVESKLASSGQPLLAGGSAYCNIYSGGARESHFCSASIGWHDIIKDSRPIAWLGVTILHLPMVFKALLLCVVEVGLAIFDVLIYRQRYTSLRAEFKFIFARVGICILLRDLITLGASVDIARNFPIIHLNYIGYDEQAHRRGPNSAFAHWSLKGIDRCIKKLWQVLHRSNHRQYDLWVYSDHGQEATTPYEELTGQSINESVKQAIASEYPENLDQLLFSNESIALRRASLIGKGRWQKLLPHAIRLSKGNRKSSAFDIISCPPTVVAMGPIGHIYLVQKLYTDKILARVSRSLVDHFNVPGVLYENAAGDVIGYANGRTIRLPADIEQLFGKLHPNKNLVGEDLIRLVKHPDAGKLVLLGWVDGQSPVSFAFENGAHAGVGPRETSAFALLPEDVVSSTSVVQTMRPSDLREHAFRLLQKGAASTSHIQSKRYNRAEKKIRVMTYNVHSCIGMDGKVSPERIARVIARYQPDVVALQELDFGKLRTQGIDQAKLIATLLGMKYHFHPSITDEEEKYGDAILSYLPIMQCKASVLPAPSLNRRGAEPRGVLWATLDVDGVAVQVLNTHLGLYAVERRHQINELLSDRWLEHPDCHGPTVLCGDFNATPGSSTVAKLTTILTDVQSHFPGKNINTFAGRLPTLCIDHILTRDIDAVVGVFVPNNELTRLASDHLPLLADITVL